jgi:membrane fusion protein (multidrug efflux system)
MSESTAPNATSTATAAPASAPAKGRRGLFIIVGLIAVGAIVGSIYYFTTRNHQSTDDAEVEGHVVTVSARVAGTITEVNFTDNQQVTGDPQMALVQIDPEDYEVRLKAARAQLAVANAGLDAAKAKLAVTMGQSKAVTTQSNAAAQQSYSGLGASKAAIENAQAAVTAAKARLDDAKLEDQRIKDLTQKGIMPQQKLDEADTALATAQAGYDQAQASLTQMQAAQGQAQANIVAAQGQALAAATGSDQVAAAQAGLEQAQAAVDAADAGVDAAKLDLRHTTVVAPAAGYIAKRMVEPGQTVAPGQPLFSVVPLNDLWIEANFKETQIGSMKPGQAVDVSIDAFPGHDFHGRVESISPATGARFSLLPPDNATGNFVKVVQRVPVRIWLSDATGVPMRPGLSADVTVDVGSDIELPPTLTNPASQPAPAIEEDAPSSAPVDPPPTAVAPAPAKAPANAPK